MLNFQNLRRSSLTRLLQCCIRDGSYKIYGCVQPQRSRNEVYCWVIVELLNRTNNFQQFAWCHNIPFLCSKTSGQWPYNIWPNCFSYNMNVFLVFGICEYWIDMPRITSMNKINILRIVTLYYFQRNPSTTKAQSPAKSSMGWVTGGDLVELNNKIYINITMTSAWELNAN